MFQEFTDKVENALSVYDNAIDFVPRLRDYMRNSLSNEVFTHECINRAVQSIEDCQDINQWMSPPIYFNPNKRIAIRLISWPAFYTNNPHKHKTWSITGVFFNKLEVLTYELLSEKPIRLKKEKNIAATQHEAGYIMPDRIHSVSNPSSQTSISIHVFNNLPGIKSSEENAIWYPAPKKDNLKEGILTRSLTAFINCLQEFSVENKAEILERIYKIGNKDVKFGVIKALISSAPELADKLYQQLKAEYITNSGVLEPELT